MKEIEATLRTIEAELSADPTPTKQHGAVMCVLLAYSVGLITGEERGTWLQRFEAVKQERAVA